MDIVNIKIYNILRKLHYYNLASLNKVIKILHIIKTLTGYINKVYKVMLKLYINIPSYIRQNYEIILKLYIYRYFQLCWARPWNYIKKLYINAFSYIRQGNYIMQGYEVMLENYI